MISDKLLVNLKILSKIQKNGRISRSCDGIISLENDAVYQPIRRFLTNDSRKQAIFEINSIINECIETIYNIINSKYTNKMLSQSDDYIKSCECLGLLINELDSAKNGILNLKFTYQVDLNTTSQLDIIMLKINTTIKDATQKLLYLQNFISDIGYVPFVPKSVNTVNVQQEYELSDIKVNKNNDNYDNNNYDNNKYDIPMSNINDVV